MTPLAGLISVAVGLLALSNWRRALLAIIVIGVLQDVFRKLTPGAPVYYIVWSMALYLGVVGAAILSRSLPPLHSIYLHDRNVRNAWTVFFLLLALQMLNALIRWGSPVVPVFGALFYLGPPLAMLVTYSYVTGEPRLRQFLAFYALIFVPACLTVYLSPSFQDGWPVLRDVGTFIGRELLIFDVGTVLKSHSGILRTGEIASWHAATAAIFLVTLAMISRRRAHWLITAILVALLIGVIILTGRRKMLMALSIFFIVQWALLAWLRKGMGRIAVLIILVGTLSSYSFTLLDPASGSNLYVQRSTSVYGDAAGRMDMAFDLMKSAFKRSAGLGLGAGSAAQGARYAGVDQSKMVGGSSESGLGMLMVELGVPGVVIVIWLVAAIGASILRNLKMLAVMDTRLMFYQVSFLSFLFANLMTFSVATQIYGDMFILIILGTVAGFVIRINNAVHVRAVTSKDGPGLRGHKFADVESR